VSKRASGELPTAAAFMRDFVHNHPDYKHGVCPPPPLYLFVHSSMRYPPFFFGRLPARDWAGYRPLHPRAFVLMPPSVPDYAVLLWRLDSVISEQVNYDLIVKLQNIAEGATICLLITPVNPIDIAIASIITAVTRAVCHRQCARQMPLQWLF